MEPKTQDGQERASLAASLRHRARVLAGNPAIFVLTSVLLLVPVFWQPRLQAGDVSRRLHNAWLSHFLENGQAKGLVMVRETTNILFDRVLGSLFKIVGPEAAQRLAVSLLVLIFVWGAFAFVHAVSNRWAWHLLPSIAMLAYGWVFQMGFFDFYLSLGLCLWSLSLAWSGRPRRLIAAAGLLGLSYLANAVPLVWTACLLAFLWLVRRTAPQRRGLVTGSFLLVLVLIQVVVTRTMVTQWSPQQLTLGTGVDQLWVFDGKYYLVLIGLLAAWGMLFLEMLRRGGAREIVHGVPFHICLMSSTAVAVLPSMVLLPGFHYALVYIAERMSLGVGICVCSLVAAANAKAFVRYTLVVVALVFFGFLYRDERALNSFQDRMQDLVSRAAPNWVGPSAPASHAHRPGGRS